uniref:PX domain-containing protein n=1 Tax=Periophthalmus magnuspinnatus TaxID=409849 RepID=A0A3B3ZJ34_9GOBI
MGFIKTWATIQGNEFIAVRVQDPRIQNEGSWNSYVDYKIFLHTNSKAFTAKTSCVRRRYSEFVWLKKKLQKNAGLVPVPDLPGKSLFSFSNDDFLERRRKGLQCFLDKVVHMTVCLSDSQLHLFLQTQLPVGHILDCVQGHTPYTVTDAILTYASSNRGYAQAQEEEPAKERRPSDPRSNEISNRSVFEAISTDTSPLLPTDGQRPCEHFISLYQSIKCTTAQ